MSEKFSVEIISPEQSILKEDVNEVTIPAFEGEMSILKDHIPIITFLRPGIIKIGSDNKKFFFVEEGTVEFSNNILLILTSSVVNIEKIDNDSIEKIIKKSEEILNKNETGDRERYLLSYKISTLKELRK